LPFLKIGVTLAFLQSSRCGAGLKSRNFPVPQGEKLILKVPDSLAVSLFPDVNFPDPLSCIALHYFFITEGS